MKRSPQARSPWPLVSIAAAVAALWIAKTVLMPLALALLGSVVLTPLVYQVERLRVGRVAAVVAVALAVSGALGGVGWVIANEAEKLAADLPRYRHNVRVKLHSVVASAEEASREVEELEREIEDTTQRGKSDDAPKVEVVNDDSGSLELVRAYGGSLASALTTAGLSVVFLIFILVRWEDLRDRVIRVVGARDVRRTTHLMGEASRRVSRYLRAYALLNLGHGVVVGVGLWAIGLPGAPLFGAITALLRFVPFLGPWVAATLPLTLSIAVFESWTATLGVGVFLAGVELVSNNVAEPWLYGSSVGLSPFAVVLSAVFWAWLWGPVGVILSTPLSVCLVVLGRGIPSLAFLAVLLGDEPALEPPVQLYQRLLAGESGEAKAWVEAHAEAHGREAARDALVRPALSLLERDARQGRLEHDVVARIREELEALVGPSPPAGAGGAAEGDPRPPEAHGPPASSRASAARSS